MVRVQSREALFAEMRADAREVHAAMARLAEKVAVVCNQQWWRGAGHSDCADWVGVELGFDPHNAVALVAAGMVAEDLPATGAAFRAGEISLGA